MYGAGGDVVARSVWFDAVYAVGAVHCVNDRDKEEQKLTDMVQTCMKRPKINTVSGLSGPVHGSPGVCPLLVCAVAGLCAVSWLWSCP